MIDIDTDEQATPHADRLADELLGVTAQEVVGLLTLIMRQDNVVYTNTTAQKRVRRFRAKLLGLTIHVTEVNNHYIPANRQGSSSISNNHFWLGIDYHIDAMEWEFKVRIEESKSGTDSIAVFADNRVRVCKPWFEGDESDYKSRMSILRLMGLSTIRSEDVLL